MSKIRDGVWRCRDGFAYPNRGGMEVIPAGALVPYDYPYELLDGREGMFEDIAHPRGSSASVEQASAAPGEVRGVRPSRGKS